MMKKKAANFSSIIIVVLSLSYSLCSFVSNLFIYKALNLNDKVALFSVEKFLRLALKVNPLDPEPYYQVAKFLHLKGIKEAKSSYFKEALVLLLKAQKLNSCSLSVDLFIIEIQNLLGSSPLQSFSEMKVLNNKYPNVCMVQKFLVEHGGAIWGQINSKDRDYLEKIAHDLLSDRNSYKKCLSLLTFFINEIRDIELIKRIVPKEIRVLNFLRSELLKYEIRFDYAWLKHTIEGIKKIEKKGRNIQEIKKECISRFGNFKSFLMGEQFIGWFTNDKQITKGNMWSNGTIYGAVFLRPCDKKLIIKAKSTRVKNIPAYMLVTMNEEIFGGVYVDSKDFQEYSFPIQVKNEQVTLIAISFENDYCDKSNNQDRNLYIYSLEVK